MVFDKYCGILIFFLLFNSNISLCMINNNLSSNNQVNKNYYNLLLFRQSTNNSDHSVTNNKLAQENINTYNVYTSTHYSEQHYDIFAVLKRIHSNQQIDDASYYKELITKYIKTDNSFNNTNKDTTFSEQISTSQNSRNK